MKRIITLLLLSLILTLNVFAFESKEASFSFETPDGFFELNESNIGKEENEQFLTLLNHSKESFKKYFKDNGVKYFAIKGDNSAQIQVRTAETNFTKTLEDMAAVNSEELKTIAALFLPENAPYAKVSTNNTGYLQTFSSGKDSGGEFSAVTYITVKNGMLYTIVFNYPKTTLTSSLLDDSFIKMADFKITDRTPNLYWSAGDILQTVLIIISILAVFVFIALIIISFVKDIIAKRKEDKSGEFKIKRRKF